MTIEQLNGRIEQAMQDVANAKSARARLQGVQRDIRAQRQRQSELRDMLEKEQADVRRLSGKSAAALLAALRGDRAQKLEQERAQAAAALLKLNQCEQQLREMEREEGELLRLASAVKGYEQRLAVLEQEKLDALLMRGDETAAQLRQAMDAHQRLAVQVRELEEARHAGQKALEGIEKMLDSLDSAKGWSTWDVMGGGLLADINKHSHLDQAQATAGLVQHLLDRFARELGDVRILYQDQISVTGFGRFADFFFDGLLADWSVHSHIKATMDEAAALRRRVRDILWKLDKELKTCQGELHSAKARVQGISAQA